MTREELVDELRDALSDACDMDVTFGQYAEAAVRCLEKNGVLHLEDNWKPISTAPTGKNLLLFAVTEREDGVATNWKMGCGSKAHADDRVAWFWNGYYVKVWDHQPTHWQWLPDPPEDI